MIPEKELVEIYRAVKRYPFAPHEVVKRLIDTIREQTDLITRQKGKIDVLERQLAERGGDGTAQ